jgi:hypothetical protein
MAIWVVVDVFVAIGWNNIMNKLQVKSILPSHYVLVSLQAIIAASFMKMMLT